MKKVVVVGLTVLAGAVILSFIAGIRDRDLWDDVHRSIEKRGN